MLLDKDYIERLNGLPIGQVAGALGLEVHRGHITCQWHADKHPSMVLNPKRNNGHCFVCGHTTDVIGLVQKVRGVGFREAARWLGANFGQINAMQGNYELRITDCRGQPRQEYPLDLDYLADLVRYPYLSPEARRFLYDERRIDPRVVDWCRLSSINMPTPCYRGGRPFYDAPSLLIPYYDADGRLLTVQSRYLGPKRQDVPRFRFPRGTRCPLFGLRVLSRLQSDDELIIAEGVTSCLATLSAGSKSIAIGSATLLRDDDLIAALTPHLAHWSGRMGCYPDRDAAGEALFAQLARVAQKMGLALTRHELEEGARDFGEMWKTHPRPLPYGGE